MRHIFSACFLGLCLIVLHACSDDDFPVPPASTVPKFKSVISNNEFAPATVTFTNESIVPERAGEVAYHWNFGDGTSSNEKNPVHDYDKPGAYPVTLVLVTSASLEIAELKRTIVIKDPNATGVPFFFYGGEVKYTMINEQDPIISAFNASGVDSYGMVVDTVESKLYISDNGTQKIFVANLDGTDFKEFRTGVGSVNGIAIDPTDKKLYFCTDEGTIGRADMEDDDLAEFEIIVTGQANAPTGIAVDPVTRTVFWNNYDGGLWSKNIDVAGGEKLIIANPDGGGSVIVVGDRIYYDEFTSGDIKIKSTLFDGTDEKTIVTSISRLIYAGIVYNPEDKKLYWGDRSDGMIRRANLDGSNAEDFYESTDGYPRAFAIGKKK